MAEEVDDNNGEDNDKDRLQTGLTTDKEPAATKGQSLSVNNVQFGHAVTAVSRWIRARVKTIVIQ